MFTAASASAAFEQVGIFGEQKVGKSVAVNVSGAGGVAAGTVYTGGAAYDAQGTFIEAGPFDGMGLAVDQATGNIYSIGEVATVVSPGGQLVATFGERAGFSETLEESPEKFHSSWLGGIAVDDDGTVYISDSVHAGAGGGSRVMIFKPQSPGDYEHYVYTGRSNDILTHLGGVPQGLALDDAGNLYALREGLRIYKVDPSAAEPPSCEYQVPGGGALALTVNPVTGEVFYFSFKDRKIHQLSACKEGKFEETGTITVTPKTETVEALAFDSAIPYSPSRPNGILYGTEDIDLSRHRGYIFAAAEVHLPLVESESVSSVTSFSATLRAQINPKGSDTRYTFQYLTEAAYEANEPGERFAGANQAPLGGGMLAAGQEGVAAAASVAGLSPDTAYRYRVVVTSHCEPDDEEALCEAAGEAETFRTFPVEAAGLPDSRAYELVSPIEKHGGEVIPAEPEVGRCGSPCKPGLFVAAYPMQGAPSGEAIVYKGFPFSADEGASGLSEYIARRSTSGWQTTDLSQPLQGGAADQGYKAFDQDLNTGVLYQVSPTLSPEAPPDYPNLYAQSTATPAGLTPLLTAAPDSRLPNSFKLEFAGTSADFTHRFFAANDALTPATAFAPEAVDGGEDESNLYEQVEGELRLVNVLPGNEETALGATYGSGFQLAGSPFDAADYSHAISDDGSRVFWSTKGGQVYVRENGESTREISDHLGKFVTASADGSRVLLSDGHLLDLDSQEATIDLTQGAGGFLGIAGQTDDLSHVYFVDTAELSGEEENEYGAKAEAGKYNLYSWHGGTITFIASLLVGDNVGPEMSFRGGGGAWAASPSSRRAEASPDGRWLAFLSRAPLTGSDNVGPSCRINSVLEYETGHCADVFLYDSVTGNLLCPSCSPSGATPLGNSNLRLIQAAEGSLPQPRYLTNSGRLYFDSQDSLSLFDTNEGVEDVYQFEPKDVGSCDREGGCVKLISAGSSGIDSNFVTTDQTGKNVFFTSRDQLVQEDHDELIDLYVAREGGGFTSAPQPNDCLGEACQPLVPQKGETVPATSSYAGPGNPRPKPHKCRKGKVRRHGHCVKKHQARVHRHNHGGAK